MTRRSVLVCNPTAQIRTNVDILRTALEADERADATLLTVEGAAAPDDAVCYGVVELPLLNYTLPAPGFLLALLGVLGDADVVVVAEYEYLSSVACVLAAKATGTPVVLTTDAVLGVNWFYGNWVVDAVMTVYTHTLGVLAFNVADDVVVLCPDHRADVRRLTLHDDLHVVPNGVDADRFDPGRSDSDRSGPDRSDSNGPDLDDSDAGDSCSEVAEPVDLLYVGRLDPIKGLDLLVETVRALRPALDVRLDVVGTGDDEAHLRALCERRGLTDVVTFHGWQDDVERFYARSDLFVLPSRSEGQPTVVLEAQAAGVPVVSADVGCVRDLIGSGAVVTERDPEQFAAAIRRLLDREAAALGRAARDHVVKHYDRRQTAERYARLIHRAGA